MAGWAREHPHNLLTWGFCILPLSTERPQVYSGSVFLGVIWLTLLPPGRTNYTSYSWQKHLSLVQTEFPHPHQKGVLVLQNLYYSAPFHNDSFLLLVDRTGNCTAQDHSISNPQTASFLFPTAFYVSEDCYEVPAQCFLFDLNSPWCISFFTSIRDPESSVTCWISSYTASSCGHSFPYAHIS